MPLSRNEIRDRALRFSRDWAFAESEDADAKSFWDGFIDLLWKGVILVETRTAADGSDLGDRLDTLFHVLNAPREKGGRRKT